MEKKAYWPHAADVVVKINPEKRRTVVRSLSVVAIACTAIVWAGSADGPIGRWAANVDRQADIAAMAPKMRNLAAMGHADAVIWISRNEPGEDDGRLEKLAAAGNGEALYVLAQRVNKTDPVQAGRLLAASADAGYPAAVKVILHVPYHKITRWE